METWIHRKIRAASLRRVLAWAVSIAIWVLFGYGTSRYIHNFVSGPFALGAADLDTIRDINTTPRYFARVTGTKVLDTGIREYTVDTSTGAEQVRSENARYYALLIGDKYLIIKSSEPSPLAAEGELMPWPTDLTDLLHSADMGDLRHHLYPFYVSDESFRSGGYWVIAVLAVYVFLLVRYGLPAWRHLRDPSTHPLEHRLPTWGDSLGVTADVEREFNTPRYTTWRGWRAGDRYLIQSSLLGFDVHRLQDLLHAYKKVTQRRMHFVIPLGKTYEAILYWEEGKVAIDGRQKKVDEILELVQERVPWAVHGHNPLFEGLFKKQRQEMVQQVHQRRSEWERRGGQLR